MRIPLPLLAVLALAPATTRAAETPAAGVATEARQRLVVLTDIEADPDDTQSLIRLLLYANQIDIEALVATTSVHQRNAVYPDSIRRVIDAYGAVQPNLLLHEPGFPTAAELQARVCAGQSHA
jgi:hypothetical protein